MKALPWGEMPYDGRDVADVIHDYVVVRGDLSEQYARDQLTLWIERLVREEKRRAWQEGHMTPRRLGPDNCHCAAWNESECGCGEFGSNVITVNPYD